MHRVEVTLSMPTPAGEPPVDAATVARTVATLLGVNAMQHGIVVHAMTVETEDA